MERNEEKKISTIREEKNFSTFKEYTTPLISRKEFYILIL